ncbi:MAG: hypothetical protein KOO60_05265 [Gemmatimonadales bacterium]|nr:hypothetical protein [Gemmatimonadales bacterium]
MSASRRARIARFFLFITLAMMLPATLRVLDKVPEAAQRQERLYFPSGKFLIESSLGFREAMADYLWFRFIQYYGAFRKDENDLRYMDLLIDGITRLDPKFAEAYYLPSLILWSDFGNPEASIDMLKRGILHNPDTARLKFQIGFIYYVFMREYSRAAFWFETAGLCSDATDREKRFAAFSHYKAGDDRVSLELWYTLRESTDSPQMLELAENMIKKLEERVSAGSPRPATGPNLEPGL